MLSIQHHISSNTLISLQQASQIPIGPAIDMSEEEPEPKQFTRTNSGRVIVFDPVKQTLTTEKAKNLDIQKATSKEKAPKWGSRVSIYEKSGSKRMIATLNLDKLKWTENVQRHCGMITNIYIMELPNERNPSVSSAA